MQPWKLVPLRICHRRKAAEFTSTGIPEVTGRNSRLGWDKAMTGGQLCSPLLPFELYAISMEALYHPGVPFQEDAERLLPL